MDNQDRVNPQGAPYSSAPQNGTEQRGTAYNGPYYAGLDGTASVGVKPQSPTGSIIEPRKRFEPALADTVMAAACFLLGYLFWDWLVNFEGWGVTAFVGLYCAVVLLYGWAKRIPFPRASWFWLAVVLALGVCFALWPAGSLFGYQSLLLLATGLYWTGSALNGLVEGKTGNLLFVDMINLVFVIPFNNLCVWGGSLLKIFDKKGEKNEEENKKKIRAFGSVLLGIILCFFLLLWILPMLLRADSGSFGNMVSWLLEGLTNMLGRLLSPLFIMAVPTAFYMAGLLGGLGHRRYTDTLNPKKIRRQTAALRRVPLVTVAIVLGVVSVVYLLFIASQIPYFFSAFGGEMPDGYKLVSEYAREGFFELCRVAAINLGLIACANNLCRVQRALSKPVRLLNIVLAGLTMLVLATAFSKMAMYVAWHGLTPKRVITSVFMVFLAGVFVAVILLQFRSFSVMRFAAVWGTSLMCLLCLSNMDNWILGYNMRRYLVEYEAAVVQQIEPNGMNHVKRVYRLVEQDSDLDHSVYWAINRACASEGTACDTVYSARLRGDDELAEIYEEAKQSVYHW